MQVEYRCTTMHLSFVELYKDYSDHYLYIFDVRSRHYFLSVCGIQNDEGVVTRRKDWVLDLLRNINHWSMYNNLITTCDERTFAL